MSEILTYYTPKHFQLQELVPRAVYEDYKKRGKLDQLVWRFDCRALWTLDRLRDRYGKTYVNNWLWGGENQFGGFRPWGCEIGAKNSDHKFGRAFDSKFVDVSPYTVRGEILADPWHPDFQFITVLELEVPWLHFGVRNWNKQKYGILKVNP